MIRLNLQAKDKIVGLQAQLWHETIRGGEMMEYYLLPKLVSFAERCWAQESDWETISGKQKREEKMNAGWRDFEYTIYNKELPVLRYLNGGYNYRIPPAGAIIKDGWLQALAPNPSLKLRYALNGADPNENSPVYEQTIKIEGELRIQVFDRAGKVSRVTILNQ